MCRSCWKDEYGAPDIDSGTIRRAIKLIRAVYDAQNGYWSGGLHTVVDNWNLENDSISRCVDSMNLTDAEDALARHLLSMTEEERASALARYEGYVKR